MRENLASRRVDQWLWFARLVKSRSLAARLIAEGAVALNGAAAEKASHPVRAGDEITVTLGSYRRTLRVLGLGARRGPAREARALYEEAAAPLRLSSAAPGWTPLLTEEAGSGE